MSLSSVFSLSPSSPAMVRQLTDRAVTAGSMPALLTQLALIAAGVLFLSLSARIQLPFYPVPLTLQTLAVMMIAMTYGRNLGGETIACYLLAGLLGAPVFAGGAGAAYMAGPTGGYLVGFYAAGVVLGALADRGWTRNWQTTAAAMGIGTALIYLFGVGWLSQLIGFDKAFAGGFVPFIYGDILKLIIAALSVPFLWKWVAKLTAKP